MSQEQQVAQHVRAIYNYNVGQKAAIGSILLWIFGLSAALFFGASMFDMVRQLVSATQH